MTGDSPLPRARRRGAVSAAADACEHLPCPSLDATPAHDTSHLRWRWAPRRPPPAALGLSEAPSSEAAPVSPGCCWGPPVLASPSETSHLWAGSDLRGASLCIYRLQRTLLLTPDIRTGFHSGDAPGLPGLQVTSHLLFLPATILVLPSPSELAPPHPPISWRPREPVQATREPALAAQGLPHACTHTGTHICMRTRTHMYCTRVCAHPHTGTYMSAHIYTQARAHTHTHTRKLHITSCK